MNKVLKYIYKNLFNVLIILAISFYVVDKAPDLKHAVATVLALYIFLASMFISIDISREIFYQKNSVKAVLFENKLSLGLFIAACIFLYFLKGWVFLSAFLTGALLYLIFFALVFIFKRKFR